ncbi:MAG: hypothetical protein ACE5I1_09960 [bacterium]
MTNATSKNRRLLSLLMYWGSWTLVAVFFSIQIYADSFYAARQSGQALTWLQALSLSLVEWYVWAILG